VLGASAFHFGTIFFLSWKPTGYVKRWLREQQRPNLDGGKERC